ncbi:Electron transfer flavoprotein alpha-subunit [Elasticomyces elasticus]|nr:Electron transfer flavoprotein alpha-subunit [Elasticomyces elasticus]
MVAPLRNSLLRQATTCLRQTQSTPVARLSHNATIQRLLSTLAVLEQREGKLNHSSLASVTAAQRMGGSVHGILAGSNVKSVADEAAKVDGLEKIIYIENGDYDKGLPENWAPMLVENVKKGDYTHVFAGHSAFGKNLMPRVAALMDVQQVSDITQIVSEDTFVRPIYAGNAVLTVQSSDSPKIVTIRGTAFPSGAAEGGSASVEEGVDPKAPCPTEWVVTGQSLAQQRESFRAVEDSQQRAAARLRARSQQYGMWLFTPAPNTPAQGGSNVTNLDGESGEHYHYFDNSPLQTRFFVQTHRALKHQRSMLSGIPPGRGGHFDPYYRLLNTRFGSRTVRILDQKMER